MYSYSPDIIDVCNNLFYRQSMLNDYITCPKMMLYRWILQHQSSTSWFASVLGTAGHRVVEHFHTNKYFKNSYVEISALFHDYLKDSIQKLEELPNIQQKFDTLEQQCEHYVPEYAEMLKGYQDDETNSDFNATLIEQTFVLSLTDRFERRFLFTGTLDQAGYYGNGSFVLRDVKFRDNKFRPRKTELDLNLQLSLYAYALRHGSPSCEECKPNYSIEGELLYDGPCETCSKKIGTPLWPQLITEKCELLWMRDYTKRKKDEYAKYIVSDTEKEKNHKTGRMIKKRLINPKWIEGYKKGDKTGSGKLSTERSAAFLEVHISDLLQLASMIRDGMFYRKAGDQCNYWCQFKEPCLGMLETEVEEVDVYSINQHMNTIDPFQD